MKNNNKELASENAMKEEMKEVEYKQQMAECLKKYFAAIDNNDGFTAIEVAENIGKILNECIGMHNGLLHYITVSRFCNSMYLLYVANDGIDKELSEANIYNYYVAKWMDADGLPDEEWKNVSTALKPFWDLSTNYLKMANTMFGDCLDA